MILFSRLPCKDHLGTKEKILVERIGDLSCKLEQFEISPGIIQIGIDAFEGRHRTARWKNLHDPPCHDRWFEQNAPLISRDNYVEHFIHEAVGKGKAAVGPYTVKPGQFHGNPSFHAPALDNDNLLRQRRGKRPCQCFRQFLR